MVKRKTRSSGVKWDSKRYFDNAVREAQEKQFDVLILKIIKAKALSKKDITEFVNHYLRYGYEHYLGYEYIKQRDIDLNKLIEEVYA
jgi:hypothetical protein